MNVQLTGTQVRAKLPLSRNRGTNKNKAVFVHYGFFCILSMRKLLPFGSIEMCRYLIIVIIARDVFQCIACITYLLCILCVRLCALILNVLPARFLF